MVLSVSWFYRKAWYVADIFNVVWLSDTVCPLGVSWIPLRSYVFIGCVSLHSTPNFKKNHHWNNFKNALLSLQVKGSIVSWLANYGPLIQRLSSQFKDCSEGHTSTHSTFHQPTWLIQNLQMASRNSSISHEGKGDHLRAHFTTISTQNYKDVTWTSIYSPFWLFLAQCDSFGMYFC